MSDEKFIKLLASMRQLMREAAKAKERLGPDASMEDITGEVDKAVSSAALNAQRKG